MYPFFLVRESHWRPEYLSVVLLIASLFQTEGTPQRGNQMRYRDEEVSLPSSNRYAQQTNTREAVACPVCPSPKKEDNICLTEGCVRKASQILTNMNSSVDPCFDFYEYACGSYERDPSVPEGATLFDTIYVLVRKLNRDLFNIIKDLTGQEINLESRQSVRGPSKEPRFYQKIRDCYKSCTDEDRLKTIGLSRLRDIIKKLGGWPVLESNVARISRDSIINLVHEAGFYRENIVVFDSLTDPSNATNKRLSVSDPWSPFLPADSVTTLVGNLLKKECGENKTIHSSLHTFATELAVLFGAERSSAQKQMRAAVDLECDLYKLHMEDLNTSLPFIRYNNSMPLEQTELEFFDSGIRLPDNYTIQLHDTVINVSPVYISSVRKALCKYSDRTIHTFLVYRVLRSKIRFAHAEARNLLTEFLGFKYLFNDLNADCAVYCSKRFNAGMLHLYLKKHTTEDMKRIIMDMGEKIRYGLRARIRDAAWLDEISRERALRKLDSINAMYLYRDELLNPNLIDAFTDSKPYLNWDDDELLLSELKYSMKTFDGLRDKVIRGNWSQELVRLLDLEVNCYYAPDSNTFYIYPTYAQFPTFAIDLPSYATYASLGWAIAHEMSHAFDARGGSFDENGNMVNWWQPATEEKLVEKLKCFVEQYSKFQIHDEFMVNGGNTLNDNIADNVGLGVTYAVFTSQNTTPEPLLPGLEKFTPNQLFWLSYASTFCSVYTKVGAGRMVVGGHSPMPLRLFGTLVNHKEFSEDFKCPLESVMNPVEKCQLF